MAVKVSLTAKVLVLCTLPLLFQFALLYGLEDLRRQSEEDADRATKSRAISTSINQLAHDVFEIESIYGGETALMNAAPTFADFTAQLDRLHGDYAAIRELVKDQPERMKAVEKSEQTAERALKLFTSLRESQIKGGADAWKEREPLWLGLRECAVNIMSSDMIEIGKTEKAQADRSPEVQKEFRARIRQLVFGGACINVLLAAILASFLTRAITSRLKKLNDNAHRLAYNQPLSAPVGGTDELADLDKAFHKMAGALKESMRKEQAVLDNTRDCICSIDGDGTILRTNPACAVMFKWDDTELLGRRVMDLVDDGDQKRAHAFMSGQQTGDASKDLEVTMRRKDGSTLDALWSARWSPEEKALFCVIRDQSERMQAERTKQDVLAMVTHDLRTPLTTVQNFLNFLQDGYYGKVNDNGRKFLIGTQKNCERMLVLIGDLLDAEKIKSGMMTMQARETDLAELVQQNVDLLKPNADEMSVKLVCRTQPLKAKVDAELMSRAIMNLVANAIKYSPRGGDVEIALEERDGMARLEVRDSGPGIAKDQLESIFQRFHQVPGKTAKQTESSGLGLTICKLIVDLHGGKIWAESAEGKGSTFIMCVHHD